MAPDTLLVAPGTAVPASQAVRNPDDDFFREFLRPYYVVTADGQYLFGSTQPGRRPDRAFYMVPEGYRLGFGQRSFDRDIGRRIYEAALAYLAEERVPLVVVDGIQGEAGYEVGLRFTVSARCHQSAYIAWFGKLMVFPPREGQRTDCWNVTIPERLPERYVAHIREAWPEYDPAVPITLYDLTRAGRNERMVLSLGIDYFGGAFKKPNLTLVWNKAEGDGFVSYHAGGTVDRVVKGLSGTGKTTLTVGPELEQDDALIGKVERGADGRIARVQLIGLEAAAYAKSEGLGPQSPEWAGLMRSRETGPDGGHPVVLAQNIDCEGVEYHRAVEDGHEVKVPRVVPGQKAGRLLCTEYSRSGTTNGRFIFRFSELNPEWGQHPYKYLATEALSFKKFDILEPIFRVTDPVLAAALDAACESIITSAIAAQKPGTRVRSYAATDFMAREQADQTQLKLAMYRDLGLGDGGKLVFFISNAGFVGEHDLNGNQLRRLDAEGKPVPKVDRATGAVKHNELGEVAYEGRGEKISVQDTKALIDLVEHRKVRKWLSHPVYGYLVPDPGELEREHGMEGFGRRFNPLNHYTPDEYIAFVRRDIRERTEFLRKLFAGQAREAELAEVIGAWERFERTIPPAEELVRFYEDGYGACAKAGPLGKAGGSGGGRARETGKRGR